eukprot:1159445-Pelagomonas_calceolata.AAC.17
MSGNVQCHILNVRGLKHADKQWRRVVMGPVLGVEAQAIYQYDGNILDTTERGGINRWFDWARVLCQALMAWITWVEAIQDDLYFV